MAAAWKVPCAIFLVVMLSPSAYAINVTVSPASRTTGTAFSEYFETGQTDWTAFMGSTYYCGTECAGGAGCCWMFTNCVPGGDVFHQIPIPSACSYSTPCTLTYDYKGRVLAGLDEDGARVPNGASGNHAWFPYDSSALPVTSVWTTRTITGIDTSRVGWHLMFETFAAVACTSYLDNIVLTSDAITTAPTPAPAPGPISAVGDPHLQNVHGERFDLMKPGKHVLINIPRGVSSEKSLLRVQAEARRLGGQCADMYFQELNVTGSWAEAKQVGGYRYSVSQRDVETPEWVVFGKVGLKVVHGRTDSGLSYLNLYAKHLGQAGFAVGGLLGEDDHDDVITPPQGCVTRMSLVAGAEGGHSAHPVSSVAEASLA